MSTVYYLRAGDINRGNVLENLIAALRGLDPKRTFVIEAKLYQKPRTDEQNKALWGVAYRALRDQSGNEPEDLHTFFCGEFFGWVQHEVMGQTKRKPVRTTTHDEQGRRSVMNTLWFADFYNFIQQRAAENGYDVPDPDPLWRLQVDELRQKAAKEQGDA